MGVDGDKLKASMAFGVDGAGGPFYMSMDAVCDCVTGAKAPL